MCGRDVFRIYWIAFMGYLSESRGFLSPPVWVTLLLGWICRGRGRSISRLEITTSRPWLRDLERNWAKISWSLEPKPVPPHLAVGCQHGPAVWEVLECVRRGAACGHQPCCPQQLWGKGNKLKMASLPNLFREKTAICAIWKRRGGKMLLLEKLCLCDLQGTLQVPYREV